MCVTINTVSHTQTTETHCGLNGSSLDRRKEEKEGQEPLEGLRKQW